MNYMECTQAFAVPGENHIIDLINADGKSWHSEESLDQIRLRYPRAEIVELDAHCREKATRQDTEITWTPTTKATFWEMLEVVPPALQNGGGFLVGEAMDHHALSGLPRFSAYAEMRGERYLVANRPLTRAEFTQQLGMLRGGTAKITSA